MSIASSKDTVKRDDEILKFLGKSPVKVGATRLIMRKFGIGYWAALDAVHRLYKAKKITYSPELLKKSMVASKNVKARKVLSPAVASKNRKAIAKAVKAVVKPSKVKKMLPLVRSKNKALIAENKNLKATIRAKDVTIKHYAAILKRIADIVK